jgi:hypothetical protein
MHQAYEVFIQRVPPVTHTDLTQTDRGKISRQVATTTIRKGGGTEGAITWRWFLRKRVGWTGSGSWPVVGFGVSGFGTSGFTSRVFLELLETPVWKVPQYTGLSNGPFCSVAILPFTLQQLKFPRCNPLLSHVLSLINCCTHERTCNAES